MMVVNLEELRFARKLDSGVEPIEASSARRDFSNCSRDSQISLTLKTPSVPKQTR